jgi:hypothetical protein
MNLKLAALGSFALALPLAIDAPEDSTFHHRDLTGSYAQIAGGAGYYAIMTRGCQGQELSHAPVHAQDLGANVEHAFRVPLRLGVRGGWLHDEIGERHVVRENRYINPHVTIERHPVSLGAGWVVADRDFIMAGDSLRHQRITFSGHLRIGDPMTHAFSISWMENVPLYSGGGYLDAGIAGHPREHVDLWVGLSAFPYDGLGVAAKTDWRFTPAASLNLRARLGHVDGQYQNGVSMGLGYRFGKP